MINRYTANGYTSTAFTKGDPTRTLTALRYIATAYLGEPLFVVRGRDLLAVPAAAAYLNLAYVRSDVAMNVMTAVESDIAAIKRWQGANPTLLKLPDR